MTFWLVSDMITSCSHVASNALILAIVLVILVFIVDDTHFAFEIVFSYQSYECLILFAFACVTEGTRNFYQLRKSRSSQPIFFIPRRLWNCVCCL
jgi:hypothetical protein